jgi:hypothetical protein
MLWCESEGDKHMSGFTNRGKKLMADWLFRGVALPTNFYAHLVTSAVAPVADTNTLGELTEIAAGNGYAAIALSKNTTDFPTNTEDDSNDRADVFIKNLVWTASGGNLPASGNGARWLVITTDEGTVANRQVVMFFDLQSDRTVSVGQNLQATSPNFRLDEA